MGLFLPLTWVVLSGALSRAKRKLANFAKLLKKFSPAKPGSVQ